MRSRESWKRALERSLVAVGLPGVFDGRNADATAVLSYHNVVPEGEEPGGDRSLHLPVQSFRGHLDCLCERYEIVSLDELQRQDGGPRPRVAITFDDAYAGAVVAGVEELARRGLPSTIFVPAGMLDRRSFWWDRLAGSDGTVCPERREHALWGLNVRDQGLPERDVPEHARSATVPELENACRNGARVSAHGWGHLNFASLDTISLTRELDRAARELAGFGDAWRPWVAYPYGLTNEEVESRSAERYSMGFRISGGLTRSPDLATRPMAVPRINVPAGLSAEGLRLRVSGLFR
jgi:peptidoglycan/xylan/chitin deacetylase (PgdA/CDA1 family)